VNEFSSLVAAEEEAECIEIEAPRFRKFWGNAPGPAYSRARAASARVDVLISKERFPAPRERPLGVREMARGAWVSSGRKGLAAGHRAGTGSAGRIASSRGVGSAEPESRDRVVPLLRL